MDYLLSIKKFFEGYEIAPVLVLRRADEYAQSLYQTLVRSDHFFGSFKSFLSYAAPLFDYQAQIKAFERAFGHVNVLSFNRLGNGSLVDNFLQSVGVSYQPGTTPLKNISTDARLTFWKSTRGFDGETAIIKEFLRSKSARVLFVLGPRRSGSAIATGSFFMAVARQACPKNSLVRLECQVTL